MAYFNCEEKRLTGWKQGNTPEKRFETPAFGGGFFLLIRLVVDVVINPGEVVQVMAKLASRATNRLTRSS